MNRHLAAVGAVIRKDLAILWPAVLVAAIYPLVIRPIQVAGGPFDPNSVHPALGTLRLLAQPAANVLSIVLAVLIVQLDPAPGSRHDWLTRPIPRRALVLAKALLLTVGIFGPWLVGSTVGHVLGGMSASEAMLTALGQWPLLLVVLVVLALIGVTANLFETGALVIFLGVLLIVLLSDLGAAIFGLATRTSSSGASWIVMAPLLAILMAGSILVLWLQYGRRRTWAARAAIGVTAATLICVSNYFPWKTAFAIQQGLSPDPAAGQRIRVSLQDGCLPTQTLLATESKRWGQRDIREAGPSPLAVTTGFQAVGAPSGDRLVVDYVAARYLNAAGQSLYEPKMARMLYEQIVRPGTSDIGRHQWLLPRVQEERLRAAGAKLRLDYDLSLLKPSARASLPVDGQLRHLPGFGWCRARTQHRLVAEVTCIDLAGHPARFEAALVGQPEGPPATRGDASYTPAWFDVVAMRRRTTITLPRGAGPWTVKLTNYQAAAHFERTLTTPTVLGAPGCLPPA